MTGTRSSQEHVGQKLSLLWPLVWPQPSWPQMTRRHSCSTLVQHPEAPMPTGSTVPSATLKLGAGIYRRTFLLQM